MRVIVIVACLLALVILPSVKFLNFDVEQKAATETDIFGKNSAPEAYEISEHWSSSKNLQSAKFEEIVKKCNTRAASSVRYNVETQNLEIKSLARELSEDGESDLEKIYLLYKFVSENVTYTVYEKWRDSTEVLSTMDGDCTDQSILLVSLLKNIGVESYIVYGENSGGKRHAWVVASVDGYWLQIDPTSNDFYFVYGCLEENCEYSPYYNSVEGMFDDRVFLKC